MTKRCVGCGSTMQYDDENKVGYSPKKDAKLCQRCFKLKNYNEKVLTDLKYDNQDIINIINENANQVFFVTDFLSLNKKVISLFKKINIKKYLVINKIDYIPYSIKLNKYKEFVQNTYLIDDDIICISAVNNYNLNELDNKIKSSKNTYICGFTNSGKSTIINNLCKLNNKKSNILESLMPNTTLDVIKVKIDENVYVFDTPGFIYSSKFNIDSYPKKYLKPVTIQIKENDIIKIGEDIFIYSSQCNSFTFYVSNNIKISKVYNVQNELLNSINIDENSDLIIDNLGFINIKDKCIIKTNIEVDEVRHSMFK